MKYEPKGKAAAPIRISSPLVCGKKKEESLPFRSARVKSDQPEGEKRWVISSAVITELERRVQKTEVGTTARYIGISSAELGAICTELAERVAGIGKY